MCFCWSFSPYCCLTGKPLRQLKKNQLGIIPIWHPKPASSLCQMRFVLSEPRSSLHWTFPRHIVVQATFGESSIVLLDTKVRQHESKNIFQKPDLFPFGKHFSVTLDPKVVTSQFQVRKKHKFVIFLLWTRAMWLQGRVDILPAFSFFLKL